jgi:hypothetical protein
LLALGDSPTIDGFTGNCEDYFNLASETEAFLVLSEATISFYILQIVCNCLSATIRKVQGQSITGSDSLGKNNGFDMF